MRKAHKAEEKSRDPHWDNIRYFSGTLVVVGHSIETLSELNGLRWLYIASWALRVPVFVMIAGYFSSAGPLNFREARRLTESILLPYILIGLLHTLQLKYYYGEWEFFTAEPAWVMWFLLSLLVWRVTLPYLAVLRYPLLMSVGAALAVGYLDKFGSTFSASRTVTFLPFFLLGWKLRQGLADELLRARWSRNAALAILAGAFAAGWVFRHDVDTTWLGMREPYGDEIPFGMEWAWAVRAGVLLAGMVVGLSLIRVVPKGRIPVVTYLGAGGLYIYLLHPLALRVVKINEGFDGVRTWPEQLTLITLAVALAAALASPPVRRLARPLVQPRQPWLFDQAPVPTVPSQPPRKTAREPQRDRVTFVR